MRRIVGRVAGWLDGQPLRRKLLAAPLATATFTVGAALATGFGVMPAMAAWVLVGVGSVVGLAGAVVVAERLRRLLTDLVHVTLGIADTDAKPIVPHRRRRDEVGAIARALDGIRTAFEGLHRAAFHDPLTGLANRTSFAQRLDACLDGERRHGRGFALLLVDLDRFKEVNDTHGHATGDRVLAEIARRFAAVLRPGDMLARLGGDEFAVLQTDLSDAPAAQRLAERLIEQAAAPFHVGGQVLFIGASVGIALCPHDGRCGDDLLRHADLALYDAKDYSRQTWRFFTPNLNEAVVERRNLEADLRTALETDGLAFVFQPKFDLLDGRVVGFETLARWSHPALGQVPRMRFIAIAESTGLIEPLGARALTTALGALARWRDLGERDVTISVNLAAAQLRRPHFAEDVDSELRRHGLTPDRLILEVTEAVFASEDRVALDTLADLAALGVHLALDDFGIGKASLVDLRRLPFAELKIDRGLVRDAPTDAGAAAMLRAIAGLGDHLDVQVTAEGVETDAQRLLVVAAGARFAQGFLLGAPMPATAVTDMLTAERMARLRHLSAPVGA